MIKESKYQQLTLSYDDYLKRDKSISKCNIGDYVVCEQIGKGAFGSVYLAMHKTTKQRYAVKLLDLQAIQEENRSQALKQIRRRLCRNQSKMMELCDSPNLVKCYEVFENNKLKIMVIQFCKDGNLLQQIKSRVCIPESQAILILKQIINGIAKMHSLKIMHRDLKPDNILIHNGVYKIADFGFSKILPTTNDQDLRAGTLLGTITTMAPEIMRRQPYGLKSDIWSLGVIFYHMIFGKIPYKSLKTIKDQIDELKNKFDQKDYNFHQVKPSQQVFNFLKQVIEVDVQKRLGWKDLINHPLFKKSDGSQIPISIVENIKLVDPQIEEISVNDQKDSDFSKTRHLKLANVVKIEPQRYLQLRNQIKISEADQAYEWTKRAHIQWLITALIYEELLLVIQRQNLLDRQDRKVKQFFYLLATRCFLNMSFLKDKMEYYRKNAINFDHLFMRVQILYKKVSSTWEKKSSILTEEEASISSLIKDYFTNKQKIEKKNKFLTGIESLQGKQGSFGYTKSQQILFTYQKYIVKLLPKLKQSTTTDVRKIVLYLNNYVKINEIKVQNLDSKDKSYNFKEYLYMITSASKTK